MKYVVCIRYAGEQSFSLCQALIQRQVGHESVVTVEEKPFYKSMIKAFEVAHSKSAEYLIAVDADVLLRRHAIADLVKVFDRLPTKYCEIQGKIFDKFFGGERSGGIHMYRMSHYDQLTKLSHKTRNNMRPERDLLLGMNKNGYPTKNLDLIVGLHDYNQSARDIYRKCFVHAFKHLHLSEYLIPYWRKMAPKDSDFIIALQGFSDGAKSLETPRLDTTDRVLQFSRDGVSGNAFMIRTFDDIEDVLRCSARPELFYKYFPKSNMVWRERIVYFMAEWSKILSNKLFNQLT
ncbi:hypothetical protein OAT60_01315 [Luminiphilus sp.]|nr:hypothetical protein [Luminiphilus sp.]